MLLMPLVWLLVGIVVIVGVGVGWLPLAWGFAGVGCIVFGAWSEIGHTINQHAQLLEREQQLNAEWRARQASSATPAPDRRV